MFRIIELLIHLSLYAEALDGEAIAQHILGTLDSYKVTNPEDGTMQFELKPKNWVSVNLDRAATNVKALRLLKERTKTKPLVAIAFPMVILAVERSIPWWRGVKC
jgi:hypothetical protein